MFIAKTDKRCFCPCAKTMDLIQVKAELCDCMPAAKEVCEVRFVPMGDIAAESAAVLAGSKKLVRTFCYAG
jgi:hypothetical protein